jgi:hypothetical protein
MTLLLQNKQVKFNQTCLGTNYPWIKGPFQRGDNHKNVKMGWGHLKILFSRTTGPILTRLGTNHPWDE